MTQPKRRKRGDRSPFQKTDCEGRRDGVAAGRDLGPREDLRADEGGSRRFPGCGGVIRTESKWTGPRGHGRQQGRGGARVDGKEQTAGEAGDGP